MAVALLAACSRAGGENVLEDAASNDFPDAGPAPDSRPRTDARPTPDGALPDAPDPPPRYPADRTLSPITPSVARNLEAISLRADNLDDAVFAKVGDSITVATQFLHCFSGTAVDLGGRTDLQGTLDHFKLGGIDPYVRTSLAATVGWSADAVLAGSPTPLDKEVTAISPRYAVVMFGSNDAAARSLFTFGPTMVDIVDRLAALGVVPLMSTVPPNTQDATVNERIPRFNAVIRAIAQARQLPLMDYGREMAMLPSFGLGSDGLHPNSFPGGACKLTPDGLMYGYNLRNLLTLQTLDRARSVIEGDPPPDPPAAQPAVRGDGSYTVPFEINSFPWSDMHDTSLSPNHTINTYAGACTNQNEGGNEYVYRLVLQAQTKVHAMVLDDIDVDVDLHLLSGLTPDTCVARNDKELVATLMPGTHYFIVDTFVPMATGQPQAGEYLFVIVEEP